MGWFGKNPDIDLNEIGTGNELNTEVKEVDASSEEQLKPKAESSRAEAFRDSMKVDMSNEEIQQYNEENGYGDIEKRPSGGVERTYTKDDPRWDAYNVEDDGDEFDPEQQLEFSNDEFIDDSDTTGE